jgi:hypothetical protein
LDAIASIQKAIEDKAAREAKAAADAAALIKCDYSCKTCSDEVSCDTCPKGHFISLKTKFCQKCPINCLTCKEVIEMVMPPQLNNPVIIEEKPKPPAIPT